MTNPNALAKQAWEIACGAYEDASSERDDLSTREIVLAGDAAAIPAIAAVYAPRLAELEAEVERLREALKDVASRANAHVSRTALGASHDA